MYAYSTLGRIVIFLLQAALVLAVVAAIVAVAYFTADLGVDCRGTEYQDQYDVTGCEPGYYTEESP